MTIVHQKTIVEFIVGRHIIQQQKVPISLAAPESLSPSAGRSGSTVPCICIYTNKFIIIRHREKASKKLEQKVSGFVCRRRFCDVGNDDFTIFGW